MRIVLIVALALILALPAVAQQPPVEQYKSIGSVYTVTALDTLHSSYTKAATVAAAKWYGPRTIYLPRLGGASEGYAGGQWMETKAMPSGWYVYAKSPFRFKGIYPNGDSTGVATVQVDTVITTAPYGVAGRQLFQCEYHIKAPLSQLRITPTTSDSVRVVPLYLPE